MFRVSQFLFNHLLILVLFFINFTYNANAQTIELNKEDSFAISGPTNLTFSPLSNITLRQKITTNPHLNLNLSNFIGSQITVSAISDLIIVSEGINIKSSGTYLVDFSMANNNTNSYGLFIIPLAGNAVFNLTTTLSTSSSSSSGAVFSSSSSSGQIPGLSSSSSSGLISQEVTLNNQMKASLNALNDLQLTLRFLSPGVTPILNRIGILIEKLNHIVDQDETKCKTILPPLVKRLELLIQVLNKKVCQNELKLEKCIQKNIFDRFSSSIEENFENIKTTANIDKDNNNSPDICQE